MKMHIVFDCDGTLIDTSHYQYRPYTGIRELLVELRDLGFELYVWTARERQSTLRILTEHQLISFFHDLATASDFMVKPHIEGLNHLVGDLNKKMIWLIGDSTSDILGAKAFGVKSIGAVWNPMVSLESLKEAGADFIATQPSECSKIIQLNLE